MPPTEGPNGRMYAYVDPETLAEKVDPSHQNQHSWIEYIAAGSGIIAILGFLTYGLGLLALWIPIWRNYTDEATAAWYAASLVPQTRVAGQGVGQLLGWPTYLLLCYWIPYLGLSIVDSIVSGYVSRRWGYLKSRFWVRLAIVEIYALLTAVFATAWLWIMFDWGFQTLIVALAIGLVIINGVAFSISFWKRSRKRQDKGAREDAVEDPHRSDAAQPTEGDSNKGTEDEKSGWQWWKWLQVGVVPYYVVGALSVALTNPDLPTVEVDGAKNMQGAFLSHTDGFWFVFDVEGDNKGKLIALRDDQVNTVTFSSQDKTKDK
jgi:hypothetical protein